MCYKVNNRKEDTFFNSIQRRRRRRRSKKTSKMCLGLLSHWEVLWYNGFVETKRKEELVAFVIFKYASIISDIESIIIRNEWKFPHMFFSWTEMMFEQRLLMSLMTKSIVLLRFQRIFFHYSIEQMRQLFLLFLFIEELRIRTECWKMEKELAQFLFRKFFRLHWCSFCCLESMA